MGRYQSLDKQVEAAARDLKKIAGRLAYAQMIYGHTLYDVADLAPLTKAAAHATKAAGLVEEVIRARAIKPGEGQ